MSDFADLLVAIGSLVGTLVSTAVLIHNTWGKKGTKRAARRASEETATRLLDAIADGTITPDEVETIKQSLREEDDS